MEELEKAHKTSKFYLENPLDFNLIQFSHTFYLNRSQERGFFETFFLSYD
jgi:hypothetical protein